MAYSTSNPPQLQAQSIASGRTYRYASTHGATEIVASGFFSNGYDLGMRVGDVLISVETDNSYELSIAHVTSAASSGPCTVVVGSLTST
jgi:hypothetical protein